MLNCSSRSGKERAAIVFAARSGMRRSATMPGPGARGRHFLSGAAGADDGVTGGRLECMSGRQLARTGSGGASSKLRDIQQAAKSIRVRNAGEDLRPRPGSVWVVFNTWAEPLPACRPKKPACGIPASQGAGAAGAEAPGHGCVIVAAGGCEAADQGLTDNRCCANATAPSRTGVSL